MTHQILVGLIVAFFLSTGVWLWLSNGENAVGAVAKNSPPSFSAEEIEFEEVEDSQEIVATSELPPPAPPTQLAFGTTTGRIQWSRYWLPFTSDEARYYETPRPSGPLRVGIQAGHHELGDSLPEELAGLRASTGARGGGYTEQETVLVIARKVKALLEEHDIVVDFLPATVPVDYRADAFVSIHADGSTSENVSGFKITEPRRDFSGKAKELVDALYESYEEATELRRDSNITRRMSGYYAFNWRRYEYAVHPMTPSVIVETGFMTSASDRAVIVHNPDRAAEGIANGILAFLKLI